VSELSWNRIYKLSAVITIAQFTLFLVASATPRTWLPETTPPTGGIQWPTPLNDPDHPTAGASQINATLTQTNSIAK